LLLSTDLLRKFVRVYAGCKKGYAILTVCFCGALRAIVREGDLWKASHGVLYRAVGEPAGSAPTLASIQLSLAPAFLRKRYRDSSVALGSSRRISFVPCVRASKGTEMSRCPFANHAASARSPSCGAHLHRCWGRPLTSIRMRWIGDPGGIADCVPSSLPQKSLPWRCSLRLTASIRSHARDNDAQQQRFVAWRGSPSRLRCLEHQACSAFARRATCGKRHEPCRRC